MESLLSYGMKICAKGHHLVVYADFRLSFEFSEEEKAEKLNILLCVIHYF